MSGQYMWDAACIPCCCLSQPGPHAGRGQNKHVIITSARACLFLRQGGDPKKRRSYFPADKQFLVTRNGMDRCNKLVANVSSARVCTQIII